MRFNKEVRRLLATPEIQAMHPICLEAVVDRKHREQLVRTVGELERSRGITTIGELLRLSPTVFRAVPNLGKSSYNYVLQGLSRIDRLEEKEKELTF